MKEHSKLRFPERYMSLTSKVHGHLMHPYENWDLTFGGLKQLFINIASGQLADATEKLDGMNIMFTYDSIRGLRFARSASDIKADTDLMMTQRPLERLREHPNPRVFEAIQEAYDALRVGLINQPFDTVSHAFLGGQLWYSAEVIYAKNPNVIQYARNYIVFHRKPQFRLEDDDSVKGCSDKPGVSEAVNALLDIAPCMNSYITRTGWAFLPPRSAMLRPVSNQYVLSNSLCIIESLQKSLVMGDDDRLGDYHQKAMEFFVQSTKLRPVIQKLVASRMLEYPGCPGLNRIRVATTSEGYAHVRGLLEVQNELLDLIGSPIEIATHDLASEALLMMRSCLHVCDDNAETIRTKLAAAVKQLKSRPQGLGKYAQHVIKLQRNAQPAPVMEGVVFTYNGATYKLTGNFAPINQLTGAVRYNR